MHGAILMLEADEAAICIDNRHVLCDQRLRRESGIRRFAGVSHPKLGHGMRRFGMSRRV